MSEAGHAITIRNPVLRWLVFLAGWVALALGIVGLVLPVMPGTVFLIIAAACFTRSSPRFEAWLLAHPKLGPSVRLWRAHGAIPLKIKGLAVGMMLGSLILLGFSSAPLWVKLGVTAIVAAVAVYILTRPEGPKRAQPDVTRP